MSDQHDAPPREAVEVTWRGLVAWIGSLGRVRKTDAEAQVALLRTLPAAARWRLIAWMAKGLEPTRGMKLALLHTLHAGGQTSAIIAAMLAAAAEAGDGE